MAALDTVAVLFCLLAVTAAVFELPALKRQRERYERQHQRLSTPAVPPGPLDLGMTTPSGRLQSSNEPTPAPELEPERTAQRNVDATSQPAAPPAERWEDESEAADEAEQNTASADDRQEEPAAAADAGEDAAAADESEGEGTADDEGVEGVASPVDPSNRQVAVQTQQVDEPSVISADQADAATIVTSMSPEEVTYEPVPDKAYAVFDHHGRICILATISADLEIIYYTEYNERKKVTVHLPDDADVTGACARDDAKPRISFRWEDYEFSMLFTENDIGNKWYVSDMTLEYEPSQFPEAKPAPAGRQKLWMDVQMQHTLHLFGTPVDKAYFCTSKQDLDLYNGYGERSATVVLWDLHLQPYVRNGQFGASVNCPGVPVGRRRINETVPMAVGSTLATVTLLTIAGYAVWRHFKVKKFNYDTME